MAKLPDTPKYRFVLAWTVFCLYAVAAILVFAAIASSVTHAFRNLLIIVPALGVVCLLIWLAKTGRHIPDSWRTSVESRHPDNQRTPTPWE